MKYYKHKKTGKVVAKEKELPSSLFKSITKSEYEKVKGDKARIEFLKKELARTDYEAIKFAEGEMSAEDYEPYKVQRRNWRAEINELEGGLK